MHVSSIGSTTPRQRELDAGVFARAHSVVVDTLDVLDESGDAIQARREAAIRDDHVIELAALVAGKRGVVRNPDTITLYKSIGSGLQDICLGHAVLDRAAGRGAGHTVPVHGTTKFVIAN
jgi:ornithine cyclodeaminase/alanine dehydrogenase-like protein (mu-crystallin family)